MSYRTYKYVISGYGKKICDCCIGIVNRCSICTSQIAKFIDEATCVHIIGHTHTTRLITEGLLRKKIVIMLPHMQWTPSQISLGFLISSYNIL